MLQLDHIFILVSPSAPEADALIELGLVEGSSNHHPGQGTSNRRFFLANTTIELLYIQDISEAVNGAGKDLQLVERAIDADSSPFALIARWHEPKMQPDFPAWHYQPDYFPEPMFFYVGKNSENFDEPLCICMPPALPIPASPPEPNNATWSLTKLELSIPASLSSTALSAFAECKLVTIQHNQEHHLKLIFNNADSGSNQSTKTFIPELSLTIEY